MDAAQIHEKTRKLARMFAGDEKHEALDEIERHPPATAAALAAYMHRYLIEYHGDGLAVEFTKWTAHRSKHQPEPYESRYIAQLFDQHGQPWACEALPPSMVATHGGDARAAAKELFENSGDLRPGFALVIDGPFHLSAPPTRTTES